jgi:hypothetical protein
MQPQLQRVKGFIGDDQLAVEDEPLDREVTRGLDDLRKVSAQWALSPRLEIYLTFVAEQDAAEAVILWLEQPTLGSRQVLYRSCLHWLK